jgi:hypothetical protein
MSLSAPQQQRQRVAILARHHPNSPEHMAAKRDLAAVKLEHYIQRTVDAAPPLTAVQRDNLALLLRGGPHGAA